MKRQKLKAVARRALGKEEHVGALVDGARHGVGDLKHGALAAAVDEERACSPGDEAEDGPGGDLLLGDEAARKDRIEDEDVDEGNVVCTDHVARSLSVHAAFGSLRDGHRAPDGHAHAEHAHEHAADAPDAAAAALAADQREKHEKDEEDHKDHDPHGGHAAASDDIAHERLPQATASCSSKYCCRMTAAASSSILSAPCSTITDEKRSSTVRTGRRKRPPKRSQRGVRSQSVPSP